MLMICYAQLRVFISTPRHRLKKWLLMKQGRIHGISRLPSLFLPAEKRGYGRTHGRMDGRTDRWTDGWTDG